ncbi:DNA polymerase II [Vibrio sp. 99-8-1]|uniref:DNA polymerase II n=1 Tax=Vibrio sp. 99-8-1 TaxID=2607602 RepID=UPI001493A60A|nr:DNA polymerase II [Vibrio sp. 99-8-1]NOI67810.1 DNA polymerase II [Vibrio sp. 99-8-1]
MNINNGFILTRQVRDVQDQTVIELWLSTAEGPTKLTILSEQPVVFINSDDAVFIETLLQRHPLSITLSPLELKTFQGHNVTGCYAPTNFVINQFNQLLKDNEIISFENDVKLADRFLMERFIQGSVEFAGNREDKRDHLRFHDAKCRKGNYHPTLSYVSLDLECSEKGILYSIGLASPLNEVVIMIGEPEQADTAILWVKDEKALLLAMVEWFKRYDPDLIVGWNVIDFDFRLLDKRAQWHNIKLNMGRDNSAIYFRQSNQSQQGFITIPGRVVLDGIDTLKTATYQFSSWSLESVSQQLLGEGKAIHNVHDRMDEINRMYRDDKPLLAKYNLQDCRLVNRIFEKTHLIEFVIQRSKLTGLELDRMGGSVAAFTNLYLPRLHRAGYVAPNLTTEEWLASPGGFVMDSIPNLYDSVLVLDFKSLYPSIIRTFLIDPMGLIEGLKLDEGKEPNQAVSGFIGGQFHRTKHFLPQMIEQLWAARESAKASNEHAFSQAIKIIMNSFYGVLGSAGCRFYDARLASSITMRGHEIMKQTKILIEEKGYQVIYGDTDSTFVALNGPYNQQQADNVGAELVCYINQWWTEHIESQFGLTSCLELEYETHYKKFLMPTIRGAEVGSKKRYAGLVERNGEQQIIFKGLESARTDWTKLAQQFQLKLYQMVFNNENPCDYIRQYVEATLLGEHDHLLVYQKRLRRKLSDYQKNIPPQVRAARLADEHNARLGRALQYQNRGRIEYLITVNGPEPSEYRQSAIDYQHYIDKQLKPVADAILPFVGFDFDGLNAPQLDLF